MNLDKKLELAQGYAEKLAMNNAVTATNNDEDIVMRAWIYADAMEAEYNKRINKELPEALQEKPKQHQCNCAHWKGGSTFMGETHTCSDCGGLVMI